MERVEELLTNNYPCCSSTRSLKDVCKIFSDNKCSEVFIIDNDRKLIGAISEHDIMSECGSGINPLRMKISECMHEVPITINTQMELEDCLTVLEHNKLKSAPVVDGSGHYCGLISLDDILSNFKE